MMTPQGLRERLQAIEAGLDGTPVSCWIQSATLVAPLMLEASVQGGDLFLSDSGVVGDFLGRLGRGVVDGDSARAVVGEHCAKLAAVDEMPWIFRLVADEDDLAVAIAQTEAAMNALLEMGTVEPEAAVN
jgi:hypothetical protein